MYGPVRTVMWQGSAGDRRPYADQVGIEHRKGRPGEPILGMGVIRPVPDAATQIPASAEVILG